MEIWKDVIWYENIYQISNQWDLKSLSNSCKKKEKILISADNWSWYRIYLLCNKWLHKNMLAHRLVAQAFIPNPNNKKFVNHINGIKTDNRVENLEWCTSSENNLHAYRTWLNRTTDNHISKTHHPLLGKSWTLHPRSKAVFQYSKDWMFIKQWWSWHEAWNSLWILQQNISRCCNWKVKSAWWFVFKHFYL